MGKKGNRRKTRWRVLPIGGEEGDCAGSPTEDEGETERVSGSPTSQISGSYARAAQHQQQRGGARPPRPRGGGAAGAYHRHRTYHDTKQPLVTTEKKTFNEEEYTKITTPRQDVLFKKGYLGRKRPVVAPSNPAGEGAVALDEHAMHNGGPLEMEHQHTSERVEMLSPADEPPQVLYTNGYMDQGVFYINGSYDLYDPYTGNLTTVVVGPAPHYAGPSGGPPVLAAVSCQPLPLQPIEWFNPAYMPAPAYMAPACPRERRKRSSTDSQNCSPQSSESTEAPGSPQIGEEVAGLPNGEKWTAEVQTISHPTYMYPGYMFGPPVYNMNGITVQGVPPQPLPADTSGSKRRKKKRRRRRRRGGVDDGSEESTSDEKELEEPASLTSHASSQELESDSKQSAGSAYFLTVNGGKEDLPEDRLTEEKNNLLETNRQLLKTGEDNITINDYSGVNGDRGEREVSLTFQVNGNTEEVTTSNSATSNDFIEIQPDFSLCENSDTNSKVLREKEENIEIINESLSNSIADRELVLKNNVSNPVFNAEISTAECENTVKSDKPLSGSLKSVSYKDVICNNQSDCKNVKGDTQSVAAKEKVKSKKAAKVLKQKHQSIVSNGYGELQMTNVQSQTFVSKMDGNEVAGSVAALDKSGETRDLTGNVSTKSEVSAIRVTEEEIYGSTSALSDSNFNGGAERNKISPRSETPKKPQRKERQVQLNQQHKVISKEDSLKGNIEDISRQAESSKHKSNSRKQPNTSGVSVVECPKTRSSTNLEDIGHKGSTSEESNSLPKTINKSFTGWDHKPTALSEPEPSLSLPETSYDSSISKVSYHNTQRRSSLGETRAPHSEDELNECEDRKFQTPILNDINVLAPETTDVECILVATQSSLTSSKVCSSQEGNKHKTTSDKHINKRNPCVARIEHSPELQKQSKTLQKENKNNVDRKTPPPIPPPRRKKWQPTNKRSSLERPPTPGRDLESNRCSEVLTDESCSSSTSHESEESVIELLSPTSSPDSKVVGRTKELSSDDDEEGVIFGSKDASKTTTASFVDSADSKFHKFKLDTVYEVKTCDRTKTGPDKEVDFTKKCKFLSEKVEVSVGGEINKTTISNPLQKDTVNLSHCTQRFRYNSDCQTLDNEHPVSLSVVESFADVMSQRVLTEALLEDRTLSSARVPQHSTLPITEAVTRWLNSQSTEKALCLPKIEELEKDFNDEYDEEDGVEVDEVGENMTGQKNVLRNPLPVSSLKCTDSVCDNRGRRVASFENINDLVNNSNNYAYQGSRFQKCGNLNDNIFVSNDSSTIVDHSVTSNCKNSLQAAMDCNEAEHYRKCSSVNDSILNISCSNDNIFKTDKSNATVDLDQQLNTGDKSNEHFHLDRVSVEDNARNRPEECNSSFTSESVEYDAEWECDLLAPSALIGGAILLNNDDSNMSVGSPDNHRSYMCDPTVSVSKYYRLGTPAEKITTMVQEEENSETETEEEVDALEHFRNELDDQDNSGHATLADELLCLQEPLPDSWAVEPIKITEKIIEDKVPQGNTDIYRERYEYYKASDLHIQSEESGNEAMIETSTDSLKPLSNAASALHRKSTLLLSQFGGDGPVPCGGICCILQ